MRQTERGRAEEGREPGGKGPRGRSRGLTEQRGRSSIVSSAGTTGSGTKAIMVQVRITNSQPSYDRSPSNSFSVLLRVKLGVLVFEVMVGFGYLDLW